VAQSLCLYDIQWLSVGKSLAPVQGYVDTPRMSRLAQFVVFLTQVLQGHEVVNPASP
jgi:hypothetical protein